MTIILSLGSNLGNRIHNLRRAVKALSKYFTDWNISIVLETKAILPPNALPIWNKPYLNMIFYGSTDLSSMELLSCVKQIENQLGRNLASPKWSPRIIDIDILLYDNQIYNDPQLQLPHQELLNRDFLVHLIASVFPYLKLNHTSDNFKNKTFGELAHTLFPEGIKFLKAITLNPQLVGIVNITPDSFSDGGKNYNCDIALSNIKSMIEDGVSVIDLGAQSTRPGAEIVGEEQEYSRLLPILEAYNSLPERDGIILSLDTYVPNVIKSLLNKFPIDWVNDVYGIEDKQTLNFIAELGRKIIIMHSLSIPPNRNMVVDFKLPIIETIKKWASIRIQQLKEYGFVEENIIIDPGIGFGKSIYQNIELLREVSELKSFGCEILVGHSRKSFITGFSTLLPSERDIETLAISNQLEHIDYLRVHNIEHHLRSMVAKHFYGGMKLAY